MTPGTRVTASARALLNEPEPLLVPLMIRSALIASLMLDVAERDTDAPKTAMADTRAMPIMRAEAVWAVRRGLRMEFSRPNLPGAPRTAANGRPMALERGRATAGASMAAPTKTTAAPAPTSATTGTESPTASSAPPMRATAVPRVKRWRPEASLTS